MKEYRFGIVGGGLVGLLAALSLCRFQQPVAVFEAKPFGILSKQPEEQGTIALSYSSVAFLQNLGVWHAVSPQAVAIETVEISVKGAYAKTRLSSSELATPTLGYVVAIDDLKQALLSQLQDNPYCTLFDNVQFTELKYNDSRWMLSSLLHQHHWTVQLLISAEGVNSQIQKQLRMQTTLDDYHHQALITNIRLSKTLAGLSVERFIPDGAIALLPWQDDLATMVLSLCQTRVGELQAFSSKEMKTYIQQQLGYQYGKILRCRKPIVVPLKMQLAQQHFYQQLLFLGNCVHSIHPIAAQGFNLSVRDIGRLVRCIEQRDINTFGDKLADLNHYIETCQSDQKQVIFATDSIAKAVHLIPSPLKSIGLQLLQKAPSIKKQIARMGMGMQAQ